MICPDCMEGLCPACDDTACTCPHTPSSDPWRRWAGLGEGHTEQPAEPEETTVTNEHAVHPHIAAMSQSLDVALRAELAAQVSIWRSYDETTSDPRTSDDHERNGAAVAYGECAEVLARILAIAPSRPVLAEVHPHIAATGGPDSVTHFICRAAPEGTHHLAPRRMGSNPAGEPIYVQHCTHCGRSEKSLREELGL